VSCGGTDHGKPYVAAVPGGPRPPDINVARADDVAVVVLTAVGPVGVGVEPAGAAHFDGFDEVALSDLEIATESGRESCPRTRA
jgi:hypothetical protein